MTARKLFSRFRDTRRNRTKSLKDPFIGAMLHVDDADLDSESRNLLFSKFQGYLDGNAMKWNQLLADGAPNYSTYDWTTAEAMLAYAEQHRAVTMLHTLLWAKPTFFPVNKGYPIVDQGERIVANHVHIDTVVGYFRGRFDYIQVWNELLNSTGAIKTFEDVDDLTFAEIGQNVQRAALVDTKAMIGLNDYKIDDYSLYSDKIDAYVDLANYLVNNGYIERERLFIGSQSHMDCLINYSEAGMQQGFERLNEVFGQVLITECDFTTSTLPNGTTDIQRQKAAALVASRLFRAAKNAGVKGIWFWGLSDKYSWLYEKNGSTYPTEQPLLFDDNNQRKLITGNISVLGPQYSSW